MERVGAGSMAEVWRARDERLGRDVALKLLDLSAAPDPTVAERFRREAVATAQLNHPNVVSVFDAGTDGNRAFLVMTLLPGRTIAELVRTDGPMPLNLALGLAIQVTSALCEAHRNGLVHRDIKPANVIVDGEQATVVDFGIAQLSGLDASLTATHAVIGSAAYMSPEHALGQRAEPASDMYGVGCLLMTMLTSQPPFTGESAVAVAAQQVSAVPPALSERIRTPRALDELITALLSKDPAARPDAATTLEKLRDIAADPGKDLVGPSPRAPMDATVVLPSATAALPLVTGPAHTALMPVTPAPNATVAATTSSGSTAQPPFPPQNVTSAGAVQTATQPQQPTQVPAAMQPPRTPPASPPRRHSFRPVVWFLVIALLGTGAFVLGTQAGAIGALVQSPLPVSSPHPSAPSASPTSSKATTKPATSSPRTTTATPSATKSGTALALQVTVQGVSQVLAGLPSGDSKDLLVGEWSTVGAAVLKGDAPNDQLDSFAAKVQGEVRDGGLSIPQGVAVLGAIETVRAAL